ncbi:hypothetical protein H6P81_020987 [Aristolochia fimbriata]|uniref:Uncharacterized protein n=1 Tax=Aristolochia fimbriata TaxID=158543 RepID=A0AAV7DZ07_ARIFI|nr:hypothetical protein H6P81_020987 [Aristolochia fimbriata]
MCFKVECKQCGKFSWNGCGRHVASVYGSIDEGKHCMCKSWPGISATSKTPQPSKQRGNSSCKLADAAKN